MVDKKANYLMTELNCSPIYLHLLIHSVREDFQKIYGNIPEELQEVFDIARKITPLPAQVKHGKRCTRCIYQKMHCKSIRCPRCHHPQRGRKKQTTN